MTTGVTTLWRAAPPKAAPWDQTLFGTRAYAEKPCYLFHHLEIEEFSHRLNRVAVRPRLRPISILRFWISEGFTQAQSINFKGWNSQVHRESPGKSEPTSPSRDNSREIGLICFLTSKPRTAHSGQYSLPALCMSACCNKLGANKIDSRWVWIMKYLKGTQGWQSRSLQRCSPKSVFLRDTIISLICFVCADSLERDGHTPMLNSTRV